MKFADYIKLYKTDFSRISVKAARLPKGLACWYIKRKYTELYSIYKKSYRALDSLHYRINAELKRRNKNWRLSLQKEESYSNDNSIDFFTLHFGKSYDWVLYIQEKSCDKEEILRIEEASLEQDELQEDLLLENSLC